MLSRAVLSIGSNLGDRAAYLQSCVDGLHDVLVATSPVYETEPWGGVEQGPFLNAVLIVEATDVPVRTWLERGRVLESAAGRERTIHWGPRTLDVDVVSVAEGGVPVRSDDPELTLPHPGAYERATVLVPWHDIEPDAVLPGHGAVLDLIAGLDLAGVLRRDDLRLRPDGPTGTTGAAP